MTLQVDFSKLPLTPEAEFRQIGLHEIRSRLEQSKKYVSEAQAQIMSANQVIQIHTSEIARLELILKAMGEDVN